MKRNFRSINPIASVRETLLDYSAWRKAICDEITKLSLNIWSPVALARELIKPGVFNISKKKKKKKRNLALIFLMARPHGVISFVEMSIHAYFTIIVELAAEEKVSVL